MPNVLTSFRDVPFILCFKYPLQKGYKLTDLTKQEVKSLQKFLDKVSKMSVQQVDKLYSKKPDKTDTYKELQVYHYAVTETFRIHVILEDGNYKIIRLDPHHKVHA